MAQAIQSFTKPTAKIMTDTTKTLLIVIGAALLVIFYLANRLETKSRQLESKTSALEEKEAIIKVWETASGRTATQKPTAEISKEDLSHYPEVTKELADMRIQLRQLKGVLTASIAATGKGEVIIVRDTIVERDTVYSRQSAFIDDGYLKLRAGMSRPRITADIISDDVIRYEYTYADSITFAVHTKKRWFLGNEKLYGTGKLQNPNAKITNQASIVIRKRDKRWNVSAGIGYDFFNKQPVPTIYAGYSLIKF